MRRGTRLFLLAGCTWIVILDAPASVRAFAAGWRGPYAGRAIETSSASPARAPVPGEPLLAARGPDRRARLHLPRR